MAAAIKQKNKKFESGSAEKQPSGVLTTLSPLSFPLLSFILTYFSILENTVPSPHVASSTTKVAIVATSFFRAHAHLGDWPGIRNFQEIM